MLLRSLTSSNTLLGLELMHKRKITLLDLRINISVKFAIPIFEIDNKIKSLKKKRICHFSIIQYKSERRFSFTRLASLSRLTVLRPARYFTPDPNLFDTKNLSWEPVP